MFLGETFHGHPPRCRTAMTRLLKPCAPGRRASHVFCASAPASGINASGLALTPLHSTAAHPAHRILHCFSIGLMVLATCRLSDLWAIGIPRHRHTHTLAFGPAAHVSSFMCAEKIPLLTLFKSLHLNFTTRHDTFASTFDLVGRCDQKGFLVVTGCADTRTGFYMLSTALARLICETFCSLSAHSCRLKILSVEVGCVVVMTRCSLWGVFLRCGQPVTLPGKIPLC
ncbi:hypothetical protein BU23DRAFT_72284 [Bimuria novae-zelandiae CBS 107.79]|uniref:Uncharacterized protein n=1 Tax=Bimuria novae-zelandiae CBS 107.79 TaxID=1447943 RepID=A0A6A5UHM2_9PLEO|nr:hypothetical protein BU23DRAFT_72284 [Bimuria novae-zelandiae CBS 107.79]